MHKLKPALYPFIVLLMLSFNLTNTALAADDIPTNQQLLPRAAVGDEVAQYFIGQNYLTGNGVEINRLEAASWMYLAYVNSQREDIQNSFLDAFTPMSDAFIAEIEVRVNELYKTYGRKVTLDKFSPQYLSDIECAKNLPKKLSRVDPYYPRRMVKQLKDGHVLAKFTVSKQGHVRDIEIDTYTDIKFVAPTLKALYQWRYSKGQRRYTGYTVSLHYLIAGKKDYDRAISSLKKDVKELDNNNPTELYHFSRKLKVLEQMFDDKAKQTFSQWYQTEKNIQHSPFEYQEINRLLFQAAQKGSPHAQFDLAVNLQNGIGCKVDLPASKAWMQASAMHYYIPAQIHAAKSYLAINDLNSQKLGLSLFRKSLKDKDELVKLHFTWHLATNPFQELQKPQEAIDILDNLSNKLIDKVRYYETYAAAYAALGNFKKAINYQNEALEQAQEQGWEVYPDIEHRLKLYQNKQVSSSEYYL
ncbi:energy transducer TonB [Catenovulum sp. 2E275]|uniref:energy transducer TonB n=1 Tax=Catenovulum sp. 2E275 TaxID=2980497 RepID=UPI0021CF15A5|nr:energy transducer TonB [Catenovulum sp. 2E275]MCU4675710.1 energy transducer TonB [Catenovulum sp. 2E275]